MNRRHMLGTLATSVAAIGVTQQHAFSADHKDHDKEHHREDDKMLDHCLDACTACMNQCNLTAHYCFAAIGQGKKEFADALHKVVDCQEFCGQSAKMIGRASPMMAIGCKACAAACEMCAEACEKHDADEQMSHCAKECRACAKSCRDMIANMSPATARDEHKAPRQ